MATTKKASKRNGKAAPAARVQVSAYLPAALVQRVKHAAIDAGKSQTAILTAALEKFLPAA